MLNNFLIKIGFLLIGTARMGECFAQNYTDCFNLVYFSLAVVSRIDRKMLGMCIYTTLLIKQSTPYYSTVLGEWKQP